MIQNENRKRRFTSKNKGGCRTCKLRHVKCDEAKPFCKKCTRWGRHCEGYDNPSHAPKSKPKSTTNLHKLMPKPMPRPEIATSLLSRSRITSPDDLETRYFRLFRDENSVKVSAGFETTLWRKVVLQACSNDFIRKLAIATAALKEARREISSTLASQHRKFAMHQYGTALQGIQNSLSSRPEGLRVIFITAILIYIFESLFGYTEKAVRNIQIALNIVSQGLLSSKHAYRGAFIRRGFVPPNFFDLVGKEVLGSFEVSDQPALRLLSQGHESPPNQNGIFSSKQFLDRSLQIPEIFSSIDEARRIYENLRFRMFPDDEFEEKLNSRSLSVGEETISAPAILLMEILAQAPSDDEKPFSTGGYDDLEQWHSAFAPLLQYSRTKEGESIYIAATILQIQAKSLSIPLSNTKPDNQSGSIIIAAREIIHLSTILVADPRFSKTFVLEIGIIPSLWVVVILCADFGIKREAIGVLRKMKGRIECVWDSGIVADTGDIVVEMLEKRKLQNWDTRVDIE